MPLIRLENVSSLCSWALWKIEEPAEELVEMLQPMDDDWAQLRAIRHAEKQREWLASRLTAKQLLEAGGNEYRGISKDQYDKPSLVGLPFRISISHTAQYGAAIIHRDQKVGIDIEYPKEKLRRIQHKFLSVSELNDARGQVDKLCVYWCAKEVLYKLHDHKQLIFNQHLHVAPFEIQKNGRLNGQITTENDSHPYDITYLTCQSLMIAYAFNH